MLCSEGQAAERERRHSSLAPKREGDVPGGRIYTRRPEDCGGGEVGERESTVGGEQQGTVVPWLVGLGDGWPETQLYSGLQLPTFPGPRRHAAYGGSPERKSVSQVGGGSEKWVRLFPVWRGGKHPPCQRGHTRR